MNREQKEQYAVNLWVEIQAQRVRSDITFSTDSIHWESLQQTVMELEGQGTIGIEELGRAVAVYQKNIERKRMTDEQQRVRILVAGTDKATLKAHPTVISNAIDWLTRTGLEDAYKNQRIHLYPAATKTGAIASYIWRERGLPVAPPGISPGTRLDDPLFPKMSSREQNKLINSVIDTFREWRINKRVTMALLFPGVDEQCRWLSYLAGRLFTASIPTMVIPLMPAPQLTWAEQSREDAELELTAK